MRYGLNNYRQKKWKHFILMRQTYVFHLTSTLILFMFLFMIAVNVFVVSIINSKMLITKVRNYLDKFTAVIHWHLFKT